MRGTRSSSCAPGEDQLTAPPGRWSLGPLGEGLHCLRSLRPVALCSLCLLESTLLGHCFSKNSSKSLPLRAWPCRGGASLPSCAGSSLRSGAQLLLAPRPQAAPAKPWLRQPRALAVSRGQLRVRVVDRVLCLSQLPSAHIQSVPPDPLLVTLSPEPSGHVVCLAPSSRVASRPSCPAKTPSSAATPSSGPPTCREADSLWASVAAMFPLGALTGAPGVAQSPPPPRAAPAS